jgi:hypothetical protein
MDSKEFIQFANKVSTAIVSEVTPEDVPKLRNTMRGHPTWFTLIDDIPHTTEGHKAMEFLIGIYSSIVSSTVISDISALNAFIYLLFLTKDDELRNDMITDLRSLENPDIDRILDTNSHFLDHPPSGKFTMC